MERRATRIRGLNEDSLESNISNSFYHRGIAPHERDITDKWREQDKPKEPVFQPTQYRINLEKLPF